MKTKTTVRFGATVTAMQAMELTEDAYCLLEELTQDSADEREVTEAVETAMKKTLDWQTEFHPGDDPKRLMTLLMAMHQQVIDGKIDDAMKTAHKLDAVVTAMEGRY